MRRVCRQMMKGIIAKSLSEVQKLHIGSTLQVEFAPSTLMNVWCRHVLVSFHRLSSMYVEREALYNRNVKSFALHNVVKLTTQFPALAPRVLFVRGLMRASCWTSSRHSVTCRKRGDQGLTGLHLKLDLTGAAEGLLALP